MMSTIGLLGYGLPVEAGVDTFAIHDLRRMSITKVKNVRDVGGAQTYACHSDPKTTLPTAGLLTEILMNVKQVSYFSPLPEPRRFT